MKLRLTDTLQTKIVALLLEELKFSTHGDIANCNCDIHIKSMSSRKETTAVSGVKHTLACCACSESVVQLTEL